MILKRLDLHPLKCCGQSSFECLCPEIGQRGSEVIREARCVVCSTKYLWLKAQWAREATVKALQRMEQGGSK